MCKYCEDLRYIEPAKYISCSGGQDPEWLKQAKAEKRFLQMVYENGRLIGFNVVDQCPVCDRKFTRDLYDNFE